MGKNSPPTTLRSRKRLPVVHGTKGKCGFPKEPAHEVWISEGTFSDKWYNRGASIFTKLIFNIIVGTSRASKDLMLDWYAKNDLSKVKPVKKLNPQALKYPTQRTVPSNVILETKAQKASRLNKAWDKNTRGAFWVTGKGGTATSTKK